MNFLMIFLRFIHIFSGVFWVGSTFFLVSFVQPTVVATGAEGQKFMQHLAFRTRFTASMIGVGILTVLSGLTMYWRITDFQWKLISTSYATVLGLGGIAGILAFGAGYYLINRPTQRMKALAVAMGASEGPPTPDQLAEMRSLGNAVAQGGRVTATLMALALLGMALAQYIIY